MRNKVVIGNWKMNQNFSEAEELAIDIAEGIEDLNLKTEEILCPPFPYLEMLTDLAEESPIGVGAQNCSEHENGAYTGEVSAAMVASTGAKYVILGHSERRAYYGETDAILKEKILLALANGLTPIFCVGEVLAEREANKQDEIVKSQIENALFNLPAEEFSKIVIAYEPVWAIGTGKTATSEQAQEMHAFIRKVLTAKYGEKIAGETSILYGGSCNAGNAKELFVNPDVDGGLIGGASLGVDKFMPIIEAFN